MSVALTNGHVLFPHFPDWRSDLGWQRRWETSVPAAVTGKERRHVHRARPVLGLTFNVTARSLNEQPQIEDRIRAAIKLGKAAIPYWGRGATLATTATGTSATILAGGWIPQAGDYVFFADPTNLDLFESALVQSVAGLVLTLSASLSRTYPTGELCWPMLFGRLTTESENAHTGELGERKISFTETTSTNAKGVGGAVNSGAVVTQAYGGRQIFNFPANWLSQPTKAFSYDLREFQSGFGATIFDPAQSWVVNGFEVSLELSTAADILLLDSFTGDTVQGRRLAFWMPSPVQAMRLHSTGPLATQFYIYDQNLRLSFADNPEMHLYFTTDNATPLTARVISVASATGGRELVTVDNASLFGPVNQNWGVFRLHLCRIAEDVEKASFRNENHQSRTVRIVEVPNDYNETSLLTGLAAHFRLEETASADRVDVHAGYHLVPINSPPLVTGKINNGASFDGSSQYAANNAFDSAFNTGDIDFTVAFWVNPSSGSLTGPMPVSKWRATADFEWTTYFQAGKLRFRVTSDGLGASLADVETPTTVSSAWHFIVAWHDSVANTINIQLDDGTVQTTAWSLGVYVGNGVFSLGAAFSGVFPSLYYPGLLDSVSFWRRVLTAGERTSLYNAGAGLDYPFGNSPFTDAPKWLYRFTLETSTPVVWRYTSDERNYTDLAAAVWTAKPVNHSGFRRTIQADLEDVTIDAFNEAGHPLALWLPYPPSAKMKVEIFEDIAGLPTLYFTGYVLDVAYEGKKIKAKCSSWLSELDRKVPRISFQPRCNYWLYETSCGISRATYQVNGTVFSILGNVVTVDLSGFSTADPNWFNRGEIQSGSGATFESRTVLKAVLVSGIRWTLTLALPFAYAAVSGSIKVWPGCDGLLTTCDTKFSNKLQFGGFPHIPTINPVIKPIQPKTTSPKK